MPQKYYILNILTFIFELDLSNLLIIKGHLKFCKKFITFNILIKK